MRRDADFLDAICSDLEDDTPRLVYADWLEEHGDADDLARAEFIRLQIALAGSGPDSPRRRAQAFRVRELLDRHAEQWLAPVAEFADDPDDGWLVRGFVDKVRLPADDLESTEELFAAAPIRRLRVTGLDGDVAPLKRISARNRLAALDLCGNVLDAAALKRLTRLSNLSSLRELGLLFNDLDDRAADLLCTHPFFQRLSLIRCGGNPFTEEARQRLGDHFGTRVSFAAERDPDHVYRIQPDRFDTGFASDHRQVLMYGRDAVRLVLFDHDGRFLETQTRAVAQLVRPPGVWLELPLEVRQAWVLQDSERQEAARTGWLAELGHQPAMIRIKRFRVDDDWGIRDFPRFWLETLETPDHPERADTLGWLDDWLEEGKFAYDFDGGDDWWLDATGEVTDT